MHKSSISVNINDEDLERYLTSVIKRTCNHFRWSRDQSNWPINGNCNEDCSWKGFWRKGKSILKKKIQDYLEQKIENKILVLKR